MTENQEFQTLLDALEGAPPAGREHPHAHRIEDRIVAPLRASDGKAVVGFFVLDGDQERLVRNGSDDPGRRTLRIEGFDRKAKMGIIRVYDSYRQALAALSRVEGAVLVTADIGSTVERLRTAYPEAQVEAADAPPHPFPASDQDGDTDPEPEAEPEEPGDSDAEEPVGVVPEPEAEDPEPPPDPAEEAAGELQPQPSKPKKPASQGSVEEAIAKLNRRHFVTMIGGKAVVATIEHDPILHRDRLVYSTPSDIETFYRNRLVDVPGGGPKPVGKLWLGHPARRTYRRVVLDPTNRAPADCFNLWRGFKVDPAPGDWSTIERHLREIICDRNERNFEWLLRWHARVVQRPERRAESAVVLRGEKGAGKGFAANTIRNIFGSHYLAISNPRHLTGHFNAHLRDVLFLFGDEVVWGGDRVAEGVLKALVTEPSIPIEAKYMNAVEEPNRLKILLSSNSEWVVPATADERRFFVLDVPPTRKGDFKYFEKLKKAIDGPELPAMMHELLSLDLSGFNHRDPPHTKALNDQKLVGADSVTRFWYDSLCTGEIVRSASYTHHDGEGAEEFGEDGFQSSIVTQVLHRRYLAHARDHGDRHPATDAQMVKRLRDLLPELGTPVRPRTPWGGTPRPMRHTFPDLATCRRQFLGAMNIDEHVWPDGTSSAPDDPELEALTSDLGEALR